jgi:hypothetical protein
MEFAQNLKAVGDPGPHDVNGMIVTIQKALILAVGLDKSAIQRSSSSAAAFCGPE